MDGAAIISTLYVHCTVLPLSSYRVLTDTRSERRSGLHCTASAVFPPFPNRFQREKGSILALFFTKEKEGEGQGDEGKGDG